MEEDDILDYWFLRNNLSKSSKIQYKIAIKWYTEITGKSIKEFYDEAYYEEKENVILIDRGYSRYTLQYKKYLKKTTNHPIQYAVI